MDQKSKPKIKILFIITQSELGGAQQFLYQLISHLDPVSFDIMIATGTDGGGELTARLGPSINHTTLLTLRRNPNIISDIKSLFEIRNLVKVWRPQIVFLNSSKAGFNGALALTLPPRSKPRPTLIYRIGGWSFNDPRPRWQRLGYFLLEYISARWKDFIILNNQHDFNQANRYHIKPRQELRLIYNGIDTHPSFVSKAEARTKLNLSSDRIQIGAIANFYPTKGLTYLIEAMSIVEHRQPGKVHLTIIGDGTERQKLEELIQKYNLDRSITLAGRLTNASHYLKAFDIFVLSSVKEGFPWVVLEAMTAQIPIIATLVGALPEIIDNHHNGLLVASRDSQGLAQAILELTHSPEKRAALADRALLTVTHRFQLSKMITEFEKLFRKN